METINIFVGTSVDDEDREAEITLEYSLRKYSSSPIKIHYLKNKEEGIMGEFDSSQWATPFAGMRWAIPEYCNFKSRAIYMDVDQLNLRDITELYTLDLNNKPFLFRKARSCVILFDCAACENIFAPISEQKQQPSYHRTNYDKFDIERGDLDTRWNALDNVDFVYSNNILLEDAWHIHFTEVKWQPWKPSWFDEPFEDHPRQDLVELWKKHREEAFSIL